MQTTMTNPIGIDPNPDSRPRAIPQIRWLLAALVLGLALMGYFLVDRYRQAEAEAAVKTRNLVQAIDLHLSGNFASMDGVLRYIALRVSEDDLRSNQLGSGQSALGQQLAELQASFPLIRMLAVFDAQGTLRHASNPNQKRFSIADRSHFQRLAADPQARFTFSDADVARSTGEWSLVQVRALRDRQGRFLGCVNVVMDLDNIGKEFDAINIGRNGGVLLRSSDSFKLIERRPRNNENDFKQPLPKNNATRQRIEAGARSGTLTYTASTDAVERIASFKVMDDFPFYVQVGLAKTDYLAAWRQDALGLAALAAMLLLGFGFLIRHLQMIAAVAQTATAQLAYRQALFSGLFEQSGFLASILDPSGRLLEVNQTALAQIGLRRDEVVGQYFGDTPWWSRAEDRSALQATLQHAAAGTAGSFEARHPGINGGDMTVLCHAVPVLAGEERYIAVTCIDITERNHTEMALAESEANFRTFCNGIHDFLFVLSTQGDILYTNDYVAARLHYSAAELLGQSVLAMHPPDRRDEAARIVTEMLAGSATLCPVPLQAKGGQLIPVETRVVYGHWNGQAALFGLSRDMSERLQAEQALQQQTLALARSNAELEQFAYVASHDLRQPLRMVSSYVQMLERRLADKLDEDTRQMMHFATDGAKRMDQMLVSLLEYSRVGRKGEPPAALDSIDAVHEALRFLAPAIAEAQATVRVSGNWPQVMASRDEFTRLWQNLIGNAVKYRSQQRSPQIDVTVTQDGQGWRFCVADNGIGIDPAQFDRLFKVFQRLHSSDQYEGNGIGLAVARKIVERHGGRIWVESAGADQGCCFFFSLPVALALANGSTP